MKYLQFISILIIQALFISTQSLKKLKFVAEICRHGARGPVFPNFNYDSEFNSFYSGQLTPTGQRQHYVLGQILRDRYIENSNLGLDQLYNHNQIYVRSTDVNRTINSAISQLQGLYPPGTGPYLPEDLSNFLSLPPYENTQQANIGQQSLPFNLQNIPVHNEQQSKDKLLMPEDFQQCPKYYYYLAQFTISQPLQIEKFQLHYKKQLKSFSEAIGLKKNLLFIEAEPVWDTFIADKFNGQPPKEFENMNEEYWTLLKEIDTLQWLFFITGSPQGQKIVTSRVLESWIQYFDQALYNQNNQLKFLLYSGHDTNVVNFQQSLNISSWQCNWKKFQNKQVNDLNCEYRAYYASQIILELFQNDGEDGEQTYVKMLYDGEYMKMCEKDQYYCEYEEFKQRIYNYIYTFENGIRQDGKLEVDEICQFSDQDIQKGKEFKSYGFK